MFNTYAENKKNDAEADMSKYISFCIVTLKTAILLTEGVFDHHVNNCIFQEILGRKIASVEKDSGPIYTENTVDAFISGISMVTCIEVWKIFLVQRDAGTTNQKQFQPVLNVFGFEYNSMIFELEAEHMLTEIFTKMSFVVKKNANPQIDENPLQNLPKKSNVKKSWKKKLAKNIVLKQKFNVNI